MPAAPDAPHGSAVLSVTGLTVRDGRREIVTGVELLLRPGERVGVVGPSSADVTAVLRVLAGLQPPAAGAVVLGQADGARSRMSYLAEDHRLIGTLTAVENLLVTVLAGGRRRTAALRGTAEQQLAALGLAPATWHNLVEQLSGGQQQRVALGRALVTRPQVAVLDQPTSELDPDTVELVDALLLDAQHAGMACVVASDDELVLGSCDRLIDLGLAEPGSGRMAG